MSQVDFLARLAVLFQTRGSAQYGGEAVSQLQHGLQSAYWAEHEQRSAELITAALLHDVGHLLTPHDEDCFQRGVDDRHEDLGERYLAKFFGPGVTEPVRLHVPAKRYLCATEPDYLEQLSAQSLLSLQVQGGPMSAAEIAAFEQHPHFLAAVQLRRYDDRAKDPELRTPDFAHYLPIISSVFRIY